MDNPEQPRTPDPTGLSNAQTQSNLRTALTQYGLGATNQVTPYGSLSYEQIGTWADGTPRFQSTTTLSPDQQRIHDQIMGIGNRQLDAVSDRLSTPFSMEGAPELRSSYNTDFSADRQRVEDALMGRLNTQLGQDRGSLEQNLTNRGITQGSEAYTNAMRDFSRTEQEARTSAILGAGQEQSRLANLERDAATFQNAARGQYGNERLAERNQPLNELGALFDTIRAQSPDFQPTPQVGVNNTDTLAAQQLAYQGALNAYNAQMAGRNQMIGGLFGLGGPLLQTMLGQPSTTATTTAPSGSSSGSSAGAAAGGVGTAIGGASAATPGGAVTITGPAGEILGGGTVAGSGGAAGGAGGAAGAGGIGASNAGLGAALGTAAIIALPAALGMMDILGNEGRGHLIANFSQVNNIPLFEAKGHRGAGGLGSQYGRLPDGRWMNVDTMERIARMGSTEEIQNYLASFQGDQLPRFARLEPLVLTNGRGG